MQKITKTKMLSLIHCKYHMHYVSAVSHTDYDFKIRYYMDVEFETLESDIDRYISELKYFKRNSRFSYV